MIDTTIIDNLQEGINRIQNTQATALKLLDDFTNKALQKQFMIDTFMVEKFQRDYKDWENDSKNEFINNEISMYNHKIGQITKLNYEVETLTRNYESKQRDIQLPKIKLSKLTIEEFDQNLLQGKSELGPEIELDQVFSLDGREHPVLDLEIFTKLLTIEFRLRIERMIKYEILTKIKKEMTAINRKWSNRDANLREFVNQKLMKIIKEVNSIRELADENEYDAEEEGEEDDIEPEEQEIEEQEIDRNLELVGGGEGEGDEGEGEGEGDTGDAGEREQLEQPSEQQDQESPQEAPISEQSVPEQSVPTLTPTPDPASDKELQSNSDNMHID